MTELDMSSAGGEDVSLEEEVKRLREENLYLKAEIENLKKLMLREVDVARREATGRMLLNILSIYEEVERAYTSMLNNSDTKLVLEGLGMLIKEMKRLLVELGVSFLETVGKRFDPFIHEAVGFIEREDVEEGTIVAEISRGYEYAGRILKPPRVIVARRKSQPDETQSNTPDIG